MKPCLAHDDAFMRRALLLAERGRGRTTPNPMVGAVVVSPDAVVVGAGYHERAGDAHAEVVALGAAGPRARGATLYCTMEPCCHVGRTGPCAPQIVEAGIARVVVATEDPNPLVNGGGVRFLREHGVAVDVGAGRQEAARLNEPFFTWVRHGRPFVTAKIALSADGRTAQSGGHRVALTSAAANRHIHRQRAEVDGIGVGSGTVLSDDPLLTARGAYRYRPLTRVVFDSRLRTPPQARVLSTLRDGPVIIVTTEAAVRAAPARTAALVAAGATLEALPSRDLRMALGRLGAFGLTSFLLEGGTVLHAAAWQARVIDRVQLWVTPSTLGRDAVPWLDARTLAAGALTDVRVRVAGPDVLIEGRVHRTD